MKELIGLTAREAVSLLKRGEVSPLELIEASEDRIAQVDAEVNAIPTLCLDRAREHARRLTAAPPDDRPSHYLYGLPVAIKDLTDVSGVRTTYGSTIFSDHVPERSDYLVEILEANGAIVIGKTNTPEFGAGGNTFNNVFGKTLNPWNMKMTCGGSSGGAAVALATGEVWLAAGSDLAGSLRTPASFCSVVGFRPSPGRIAKGPNQTLFNSLMVQGPMARNVADTALMLDAQTGYYPGDPISLPRPRGSYLESVEQPVKPERIGYSLDLGLPPVDNEVKEICLETVRSWEDIGVRVEEACPDFSRAEEVFQTLRAQLYLNFLPLLNKHRDLLKPDIVWNIEKGLALTGVDINRAEQMRADLYHSVLDFFKEYDLLVCPAAVAPPFDVNIQYLKELDGIKFDTYISWLAPTFAVTLTACPSISLPCGFTGSGLPVGIQIVGPPRREDLVLSAAAIFEEENALSVQTPIDPR